MKDLSNKLESDCEAGRITQLHVIHYTHIMIKIRDGEAEVRQAANKENKGSEQDLWRHRVLLSKMI